MNAGHIQNGHGRFLILGRKVKAELRGGAELENSDGERPSQQ